MELLNILTELLKSFFIVVGFISTILLIVGFLFKAKGVTFFEFFPKKQENLKSTSNVIYNTNTNSYQNIIDPKKVAAIMAAIQYHNKIKG